MVVHASSVTILQVVELVCILLGLFLNVNYGKDGIHALLRPTLFSKGTK